MVTGMQGRDLFWAALGGRSSRRSRAERGSRPRAGNKHNEEVAVPAHSGLSKGGSASDWIVSPAQRYLAVRRGGVICTA